MWQKQPCFFLGRGTGFWVTLGGLYMRISAFLVVAGISIITGCVSRSVSDSSPMEGTILHMFGIQSADGALDCVGYSSEMTFLCNTTERGRLEISLDSSGNIAAAQARFSNGQVRPVRIKPHEAYGLNFEKMKTVGSGSSTGSGSYSGNCRFDSDRDAIGNRCGRRSAQSRPGG